MTPAEFKTIRESLGLNHEWIADQSRVKLRTVQYWETGRITVPNDVAQMLSRIDDILNDTVSQSLSLINGISKQYGSSDNIVLIRYKTNADLWRFRPDMKPFPTTTHAAMLSRLRRALLSKNIPSTIEFMEPEEYLTWLGDRKDNETERAAWALIRKK
jgi:transcriptional regulator with XRE-family HTH domain